VLARGKEQSILSVLEVRDNALSTGIPAVPESNVLFDKTSVLIRQTFSFTRVVYLSKRSSEFFILQHVLQIVLCPDAHSYLVFLSFSLLFKQEARSALA